MHQRRPYTAAVVANWLVGLVGQLVRVVPLSAAVWQPFIAPGVVSAAEFSRVRLAEDVVVRDEPVTVEVEFSRENASTVSHTNNVADSLTWKSIVSAWPDDYFGQFGMWRSERNLFGRHKLVGDICIDFIKNRPLVKISGRAAIVDYCKEKFRRRSFGVEAQIEETRDVGLDFVKENERSFQFSESAISDISGLSGDPPKANGGSEKQSVEDRQKAGKHGDWIIGPVIPIELITLIFGVSVGAGALLMLLLAGLQDRRLR